MLIVTEKAEIFKNSECKKTFVFINYLLMFLLLLDMPQTIQSDTAQLHPQTPSPEVSLMTSRLYTAPAVSLVAAYSRYIDQR